MAMISPSRCKGLSRRSRDEWPTVPLLMTCGWMFECEPCASGRGAVGCARGPADLCRDHAHRAGEFDSPKRGHDRFLDTTTSTGPDWSVGPRTYRRAMATPLESLRGRQLDLSVIELAERAEAGESVHLSRHGEVVAVVVSVDYYRVAEYAIQTCLRLPTLEDYRAVYAKRGEPWPGEEEVRRRQLVAP